MLPLSELKSGSVNWVLKQLPKLAKSSTPEPIVVDDESGQPSFVLISAQEYRNLQAFLEATDREEPSKGRRKVPLEEAFI